MKRRISLLLIILTILIATTSTMQPKALADTLVPSINSTETPLKVEKDNRAKILQDYLKTYDSPLAPYSKNFVEEADRNHLDWKLLPAIAGVESYFGHYIPGNSYNSWGFGIYGNNVRRFESWDEGISTISKALKDDYINRWKAQNVYEIGHLYASDPLWASKVNHFLGEMDDFEKYYQNTTLSISL